MPGQTCFPRIFLFLHVVLDVLGKHLDLGIVELIRRIAVDKLSDYDRSAVVLDVGLRYPVLLYLRLGSR